MVIPLYTFLFTYMNGIKENIVVKYLEGKRVVKELVAKLKNYLSNVILLHYLNCYLSG